MNKLFNPPSLVSSIALLAKANWPIVAVALATWISIIAFLDPAGSYPRLPEGPGLTVDEIFNAEQGVYLIEAARLLGWLNLVPCTSQEAFRAGNEFYNPDHPPLGRYWLGLHHHLAWWLWAPFEPDGPVVTACARTGSASALALTVLLIGCFVTHWSGRVTGFLAAVSLVLMPRVYGHAHLACLETITNLTCTLAVLVVAHCWSGATPLRSSAASLSGVLFGLALLTKIQAVLIPIPVFVWAVYRWKTRAVLPLFWWSVTAAIVFLAGWPYLWFAPVEHSLEYLGRTTHRATISVWYFGQKYPDKLAPWHYPFVMFGLTVPVLLHAFGILGLFQSLRKRAETSFETTKRRVDETSTRSGQTNKLETPRNLDVSARHRDILLFACTLFPLVVFAMPGVAVYDGERLFLTCFPLWAIFVGRGASVFWVFLSRKTASTRTATVVVTTLLAFSALPLVTTSPCHLCYYNEVTFLLGGADRAGLEIDYWGEGITRRLLSRVVREVPEGETVAVVPTLHPFQAADYYHQSPILRSKGIKTVELREKSQKYILVYRRLADLPPDFMAIRAMPGWEIIESSHEAVFARRQE